MSLDSFCLCGQGAHGERLSQQFADEYIRGAGIHRFQVKFHYSRKTNHVVLDLSQDLEPLPGISILSGNVQLKIQEKERFVARQVLIHI